MGGRQGGDEGKAEKKEEEDGNDGGGGGGGGGSDRRGRGGEGKVPTIFDKRVDFPDSDDVCQHVTQPLWIHKVEVAEEWVVIVQEGAVVMEKPHGLF